MGGGGGVISHSSVVRQKSRVRMRGGRKLLAMAEAGNGGVAGFYARYRPCSHPSFQFFLSMRHTTGAPRAVRLPSERSPDVRGSDGKPNYNAKLLEIVYSPGGRLPSCQCSPPLSSRSPSSVVAILAQGSGGFTVAVASPRALRNLGGLGGARGGYFYEARLNAPTSIGTCQKHVPARLYGAKKHFKEK